MSGQMQKGRGENSLVLRNTTIKVRLHPTPGQAALIDKTFMCCRYLWNQMLADEREFYAATGEHFIPTPAKYKKSAPFLKEVDSQALAAVHQNLRRAFQRFFSEPERFGYPAFKAENGGKNSYTTYAQYYKGGTGASVFLTESGVRLPKLGEVKATLHRRPLHWWILRSATVSRASTGEYECSLLFEYPAKPAAEILPTEENTLGLSYSMAHFYVDSDGCSPDPPHWLQGSQEKLAAMQRKLARMEPGSKNHQQQLQKIRRLHRHIANQRKDFIHKESHRLAERCGAVCVRDDDLQAASRRVQTGNVMDNGFGAFRTCLAYKLARQGKHYITVSGYLPTTRTCHLCGYVNETLRPHDRVWRCPACGARHAREENAAKNIKASGLAQFYKDRGAPPPVDNTSPLCRSGRR